MKGVEPQPLFSQCVPGERVPIGMVIFDLYKGRSSSPYLLGLSGLEPPTSRLSGVRSNRLSYKPAFVFCVPAATYSPMPSPA